MNAVFVQRGHLFFFFGVFVVVCRPDRRSLNSNNVKCEAAGSVLC